MNRPPDFAGPPRRSRQRGAALLEALAAIALLSLAATGAGSLAQRAALLAEEATRLDTAKQAAEAVLARLAPVGWYRLPEFFREGASAETARIATGGDGAPSDWEELAARLPRGRIEVRLTGLGRGGVRVRFEEAVALRLVVRVAYDERGGRRTAAFVATRF